MLGGKNSNCAGSDLLILVYTHDVEPVGLLYTWQVARLKEFNVAGTEGPEESFISDVAHAIQCQLGTALLQKYRFDFDLV